MKKGYLLLTLITVIFCLVSCQNNDDLVIRVGASVTPHAEILRECKDYLSNKGYTLEIIEFDSYVLPNIGVHEGSLDANYFQHIPYLNEFNLKNGTSLVAVKEIHVEPLGLYAGKKLSISDVSTNDRIGIPDDVSNGARALNLLHDLGWITLDTSKGLSATKYDILTNPYNLEIVEFTAETIATHLPDLSYGIINGNNALYASIVDKALVFENLETARTFANVLCVNENQRNSEKTKALIEALSQPNIAEFIADRFKVFFLV